MARMECCQIQGIEELFSQKYVNRDLARYRARGPDKTTRMLTGAIKAIGATGGGGVDGMTLLDIGGGVGAVQHELLGAGIDSAVNVDASTAYIRAARAEAERRGLAERVVHLQGNFVDVVADIAPADIVTLDRVICCYPDMEKLVSLSAARARKLYGLVYPRDTWWMKFGLAIQNIFMHLRRRPYRAFTHRTKAVEALLVSSGLRRRSYDRTLVWQVAVYTR